MRESSELEEETRPYTVRLSEVAENMYRHLGATPFFPKLRKMVELLDTVPEIGRVYDPEYPASRPHAPVRVTCAGRYGIYYTVHEDAHEVIVINIEDQRRNPLNRHFGIYPHEAE